MPNTAALEPTLETQTDLALLDGLIARYKNSADPALPLLREHLQSSRVYLLGAMPGEYAHSLRLSKDAGAQMADKQARKDLLDTLAVLEADFAARPRIGTPGPSYSGNLEEDLTHFFKKDDTSFGVFYPKDCVIAVFPSFSEAAAAGATLLDAGVAEHHVLVAPGSEVVRFFSQPHSTWGEVMGQVSRFFETEQVFVDDYIARARAGAGFMAVHTADELAADRIRALILPFSPEAVRWYRSSGIQSLV